MADRSRDKDKKPVFDAELPADEELEEEPEESAETEGEAEGEDVEGEDVEGGIAYTEGDADEDFEESAPARKIGGGAFAFSFLRRRVAEEEVGRRDRQMGSVKEAHERVHIDDRPSAIFALICAATLLVLLALPWVGNIVPKSTGPTLTPLVVPTGAPVASSSASASASASIAISPSPIGSPSTSPAASPSK